MTVDELPVRSLLVNISIRLDQRYPVEEGGRVETMLLGASGTQVVEESQLFSVVAADDVFNHEAKTEDCHQIAHTMNDILMKWNKNSKCK